MACLPAVWGRACAWQRTDSEERAAISAARPSHSAACATAKVAVPESHTVGAERKRRQPSTACCALRTTTSGQHAAAEHPPPSSSAAGCCRAASEAPSACKRPSM